MSSQRTTHEAPNKAYRTLYQSEDSGGSSDDNPYQFLYLTDDNSSEQSDDTYEDSARYDLSLPTVISSDQYEPCPHTPTDLLPLRAQPFEHPATFYALFQSHEEQSQQLLPTKDKFHGDSLQLPKPPNIFRMATKNFNGVSVNKIDDQVTLLCLDQKKTEVDIQGIIEHTVDTGKYHVRQSFHKAANKVFQNRVKIELGSSAYTSVTNYKPGGSALVAQGDITGRIYFHDSNKYGRWSHMHTKGAHGKMIVFITAYQVCKKPTNRTGTTAYHQQQAAFVTEQRPNTEPRHNFRTDLLKFIKQQQNRDHHIVLSGDFNEHIQDNRSFL
jgi:hypothetical protein